MPTTATQTYSIDRLVPLMDAKTAKESMVNVQLAASKTYAKGTLLGEITTSLGTFTPYKPGGAGGETVPYGILEFACTTDASGNITVPGEWGVTRTNVPVFTHGTFAIQDLVLTGDGLLDANAVTKLGGAIKSGNLAAGTGIFSF